MIHQIILYTSLLVLVNSRVSAVISVNDSASIQQQVRTQAETMAKWQAQYNQMMQQLEQAKRHYEALTGTRGLGQIINDSSLREYLPNDWQKVYDDIRAQGYAGLKGRGAQIYQENKIFDSCTHLKSDDHRKVCEAQAVKSAQDKGFLLEAYDTINKRMKQIDQLMGQINTTQDPKSIAELQARINIEQANIQNEQTRLELYQMISTSEDRILAQRQREMEARTWSARGGVHVEPVTFK